MQILHPFTGSVPKYEEEVCPPDRYRPDRNSQCGARQHMPGHGFYRRTLVAAGLDGSIHVRRYLCRSSRLPVSLQPEFISPDVSFRVAVIAAFLIVRLLKRHTVVAALTAAEPLIPFQRGQF